MDHLAPFPYRDESGCLEPGPPRDPIEIESHFQKECILRRRRSQLESGLNVPTLNQTCDWGKIAGRGLDSLGRQPICYEKAFPI